MGINNYYFNNIDGRLIDVDNYDFWLTSDNQGSFLEYATSPSNGKTGDFDIVKDRLVLWFDVNSTKTTTDGSTLTSITEWDNVNITPQSGITLCDFGLTGVDNGRYTSLSGITTNITSADTKVILYPVTGYTITSGYTVTGSGKYVYPISFNLDTMTSKGCKIGDTLCLNGGFYQGYFKLDFEDPNPIQTTGTTFTDCGPTTKTDTINVDKDGTKYNLMPTEFDKGWSMETWVKWDNTSCTGTTGVTLNDVYSGNTGFFFYIGTRAENKFHNIFSGETGLTTCDGIVPLSPDGEQPEVTNKGVSWFTRSNYGRTGCDLPTVERETTTATTYCDQLSENALGFRVTDDGRIGYRKMTVSGFEYFCDDNGSKVKDRCTNSKYKITGTTMEEGYSEPIIQSGDNWTHIVVTYSQNTVKYGLPAGTLRFWVNGRVVYRVDDFIGLQLRALDEWSSKQLGVPYNISWGGGTQGLLESQTFGGPDNSDQGLDLATNFAGTFDGELSQLRFYDKALNIMEIRNNFYVDTRRYCVANTFGGYNVIQMGSELCGECKAGQLIYTTTLGVDADIYVTFSLVGTNDVLVTYFVDIKEPLNKDLTLSIGNTNGLSGSTTPLSIQPTILIPAGSTTATTTLTFPNYFDVLTNDFETPNFGYVINDDIILSKRFIVDYELPVIVTEDDNTPITDVIEIYYQKINKTTIDITDVSSMLFENKTQATDSYVTIPSGQGYGYILIPQFMDQPSMFRNSNQGCMDFAIPMINQGTVLIEKTVNNQQVGYIYNIYRTFVSSYGDYDIWMCV